MCVFVARTKLGRNTLILGCCNKSARFTGKVQIFGSENQYEMFGSTGCISCSIRASSSWPCVQTWIQGSCVSFPNQTIDIRALLITHTWMGDLFYLCLLIVYSLFVCPSTGCLYSCMSKVDSSVNSGTAGRRKNENT